MDGSPTERLSERLQLGPTVLFVGQRYLCSRDGFDPFVDAVAKRLGAHESTYGALFEANPTDRDSLQLWMAQLCDHISPPSWLSPVVETPWNAVYTSAVDTVLRTQLRNEWRDVQPVLSDRYRPENPRNPVNLACTHLYGAVGEASVSEAAPLSQLDLLRRGPTASVLLQRIVEDLTPLGSLIIVGYDPLSDWLQPRDLAAMLAHLSPGQAHIFGYADSVSQDPNLGALLSAGVLTSHTKSITDELGALSGLQLSVSAGYAESERALFINNEPHAVPKSTWNMATRAAIPLTVADVAQPPSVSSDARYEAFRRFLGSADGLPDWEGFKRGFAFEREFEPRLLAMVERALAERSLSERPIVLHGAAGTGKTTAVARLALTIASARQYPVLFVPTRGHSVAWRDIDQFVEWAEGEGAGTALIVWDGMVSLDDYFAFSQRLAARGRQACVLGTSYEIQHPADDAIKAESELSPGERAEIIDWIREIAPGFAAGTGATITDRYWLALLYRALPPSRQQLRRSVLREVERVELSIRSLTPPPDEPAMTALQEAMVTAGLITREQVSGQTEDSSEATDVFERLTNYTMVPGRFGLFPPVDLTLRAVGGVDEMSLRQALGAHSVVRWYEDQVGNISLGPRNTVEAEIIVKSRLGTAAAEVAVAETLLGNIRDDSSPYGDGPEVRFAADLVRAFGSGGPERTRFWTHWLMLADALERLRTERAISAPYLMVQEANLRREWAQVGWNEQPERAAEQALRAFEVAESALAIVPNEMRNSRLRSMLLVELASAAGGMLTNSNAPIDPVSQTGRLFESALSAIQDARQIDPGSYYPLDVLFWVTRNLLTGNILKGAAAVNALAAVSNSFLTADPDMFPPTQQEMFFSREYELAELLGDTSVAAEAWDALTEMGSGAGHYIEAIRRSGLRPGVRLGDIGGADARAGYDYLRENWTSAGQDPRNLELALDLWWLSRSDRRLLTGERVALPFSESDWAECLTLALQIEEGGRSQRAAVVKYVRGLAEFHLKRYGAAFSTFDELESMSEGVAGRKRIVRTYRASNPGGGLQFFSGSVTSIEPDGRDGRVFIPSIGRHLRFFPRDFGWPTLRPGDALDGICVAFNLRGISADSPRHEAREGIRRQAGL